MPTVEPARRWHRVSPDRFMFALLLVVWLVWPSERFQWFAAPEIVAERP